MALIPTSTDYTDRDFDSLRVRLENLVGSAFPDWTNFEVANFGNILLDLYAFVGDVLTFYQDNQARESRITTATERRNLIALTKLVGYTPESASAAIVQVTLTLDAVPVNDVIFPIGTIVRTEDIDGAIEFQSENTLQISAGANPPEVTDTFINSDAAFETFDALGLPNDQVELSNVPYLDDTAVVVAGDGTYTEVRNFLGSNSTDKHYVVDISQVDRATITFGDGVNGSIPIGTITVAYQTGGGVVGNVEANTLVVIEGTFTDIFGNAVRVSSNNLDFAAGGGKDRQGVEEIRLQAPEQTRVLNRTVSREDYEINAKRLPEVERALMLTSNEDPSIGENTGLLFIIPRGDTRPELPTPGILELAEDQVTEVFPHTLTFVVEAREPVFLTIDVFAVVYLIDGASEEIVRQDIELSLEGFFALQTVDGEPNPDVDFGFNYKDAAGNPSGEIASSNVFNVIRDLPSIRKMGDQQADFTLNGGGDVAIALKEFPIIGDIVLINGDTGLQF